MTTTADPDSRYWSASEACRILAPHLSAATVRTIIRAAGLTPAATRHSSSFRGRPARVYEAEELIRLLAVVATEETASI